MTQIPGVLRRASPTSLLPLEPASLLELLGRSAPRGGRRSPTKQGTGASDTPRVMEDRSSPRVSAPPLRPPFPW